MCAYMWYTKVVMSGTVGGCKSIVTDYGGHKRTMNYGSNLVGYKIGMNSRDGWIVQRGRKKSL